MDPAPSEASLSTLYPLCMACRKQIDSVLASLESSSAASAPLSSSVPSAVSRSSSSSLPVAVQQRLVALTQQLLRDVARMECIFEGEKASLPPQQVALWKRRISVLLEDSCAVQSAVNMQLGAVHRRQMEETRQREALLDSRRGRSVVQNRASELSFAREREKLAESHSMLDAILSQGRSALDKVVQQNSVLKSAKRKILDMNTSSGLAASLLGAISRREATDRRLVWGGMFLTLLFFFFLYRLVHRSREVDDADSSWDALNSEQ
ncbi:putative golgi SNARE [Toxoplasma gondii RUB]|uniref:Putative golgi SNARE n=2 Tax=Toxoplasma gondii TaxID=5811 RepID=A0A086LJB5_TOXGO|nr:putative golgi SNARE [Toxoplasma gondii p89]KFG56733.1 putative golgi SNARE [Toxoplasma gondii RUB]